MRANSDAEERLDVSRDADRATGGASVTVGTQEVNRAGEGSGGVRSLFLPAASLPVPPRRKRGSWKRRAVARLCGLALLKERGRSYFAQIGSAGGKRTAERRQSQLSRAMPEVKFSLPLSDFRLLQKLSASSGQSLSALCREAVRQFLAGCPSSTHAGRSKRRP